MEATIPRGKIVPTVRIVDPDPERNPGRGLGPVSHYPEHLIGVTVPVVRRISGGYRVKLPNGYFVNLLDEEVQD